ncbi:MAG: GNAT family N-acetyltransferase [Pseudomonadales bacterium]
MSFYESAGVVALGSRLRGLADRFTRDAALVYELYGVPLDPRWFPVCAMLEVRDSMSVSALAEAIGHSHAAVSQVIRRLVDAGLAVVSRDADDSRVSRVSLTEAGREAMVKMQPQRHDVEAVVKELLAETAPDFWASLDRMEGALARRGFYERVRRRHAASSVDIVRYDESRHRRAFRELNLAWIRKHWEPEASDYAVLDDPQSSVLNVGGYIAIAERGGEPVGTCALIPMADGGVELAKMAVTDSAKGLGIGERLGRHIIEEAQRRGAGSVYLETNLVLEPAIALYRKLGFEPVSGRPSPYDRCNLQMRLELDANA